MESTKISKRPIVTEEHYKQQMMAARSIYQFRRCLDKKIIMITIDSIAQLYIDILQQSNSPPIPSNEIEDYRNIIKKKLIRCFFKVKLESDPVRKWVHTRNLKTSMKSAIGKQKDVPKPKQKFEMLKDYL